MNKILFHRSVVSSRIMKGFQSSELGEDIEKARQKVQRNDGDIHPNGKWVWSSSANGGKGDWRTRSGRRDRTHREGADDEAPNKKTYTAKEAVELGAKMAKSIKIIASRIEEFNRRCEEKERELEKELSDRKKINWAMYDFTETLHSTLFDDEYIDVLNDYESVRSEMLSTFSPKEYDELGLNRKSVGGKLSKEYAKKLFRAFYKKQTGREI